MTAPFQSYSNMLALLNNDSISRKEIYNELMEKEKQVLEVSSRIANQEKKKTLDSNLFVNLSISDIIARFAYNWQNIFTELIIKKKLDELPVVLFQNERKFYVGMMLLMIAIFLFLSTT